MARVIGVVTTSRSDFGCLTPLIEALLRRSDVNLQIYAGGTHFSPVNDFSISEVEANFAKHTIRIPCAFEGDQPADIAKVMGQVLLGYADEFRRSRPDLLIVVGDRYDMIPVVIAALPFNIPIAHLSGGEVTEGAIDDAIRHAVTKLAHLHFPVHELAGKNVRQLGEEAWRIKVAGEPSLDHLTTMKLQSKEEVYAELGFDPEIQLSVFTYHPTTIDLAMNAADTSEVFAALQCMANKTQLLLTHPNSDPGSSIIIDQINEFSDKNPHSRVIPSLGKERYFQLIAHCDALVGNSSSGLVEAASFSLPVVNIGDRQAGRLEPRNVITVPAEEKAIIKAWESALSSNFRRSLMGMDNPYGDGNSSDRIVELLMSVDLSNDVVRKKFVDVADWNDSISCNDSGPSITT